MKRIILLIAVISSFSSEGFGQNDKKAKDPVEAEYIPVEGRSDELPKALQGKWVLSSGINSTTPPIDIAAKKPTPGTEMRRDSVTQTTTMNGETRTITEVNIERIGTPEKQITPPQKNNMHRPEKPSISFYGLNETFSGFTGCNKYSGRYKITGNKIVLLNAAASTKMICLGEYDEKEFLNTLHKVNAFRANSGSLELMNGSDVLLVFSRK